MDGDRAGRARGRQVVVGRGAGLGRGRVPAARTAARTAAVAAAVAAAARAVVRAVAAAVAALAEGARCLRGRRLDDDRGRSRCGGHDDGRAGEGPGAGTVGGYPAAGAGLTTGEGSLAEVDGRDRAAVGAQAQAVRADPQAVRAARVHQWPAVPAEAGDQGVALAVGEQLPVGADRESGGGPALGVEHHRPAVLAEHGLPVLADGQAEPGVADRAVRADHQRPPLGVGERAAVGAERQTGHRVAPGVDHHRPAVLAEHRTAVRVDRDGHAVQAGQRLAVGPEHHRVALGVGEHLAVRADGGGQAADAGHRGGAADGRVGERTGELAARAGRAQGAHLAVPAGAVGLGDAFQGGDRGFLEGGLQAVPHGAAEFVQQAGDLEPGRLDGDRLAGLGDGALDGAGDLAEQPGQALRPRGLHLGLGGGLGGVRLLDLLGELGQDGDQLGLAAVGGGGGLLERAGDRLGRGVRVVEVATARAAEPAPVVGEGVDGRAGVLTGDALRGGRATAAEPLGLAAEVAPESGRAAQRVLVGLGPRAVEPGHDRGQLRGQVPGHVLPLRLGGLTVRRFRAPRGRVRFPG
ncbi:hypothetical protein [Kitasatospora paranensis]|uniref:hypothetical protein n=1 Tax=Kitasatospora paranensis TaxID=258053 RepID=UPI003621282E